MFFFSKQNFDFRVGVPQQKTHLIITLKMRLQFCIYLGNQPKGKTQKNKKEYRNELYENSIYEKYDHKNITIMVMYHSPKSMGIMS